MTKYFILFIILNFSALALGGLFTGGGVSSNWYQNLNQAPWTPPGWVFGFAWMTIMICFSFYMAKLFVSTNTKSLVLTLFILQWILNVSWNPVFFYYQNILGGLIIISSLTLLIAYFSWAFRAELKLSTILILPYFLWLLIATSLNLFIFIKN